MNGKTSKPLPEKLRKQRLILLLLFAGLAIAALVYYGFLRQPLPENTVRASGTIEAAEMDVSPKVAGRIVKLLVDEGDRVRQDQLIAVLDRKELAAQVEQAKGNLVTAEAMLADLLAGSREEQIREARANYEKALANERGTRDVYRTATEAYRKSTELKARLASAEANYKAAIRERDATAARLALVEEGPRKEEIDRLKAILDQARAQLKNAEQDYKRFSQLYRQGAISGQQFDAALSARDSQRAAVDAAEANYREALAGSRTEEVKEAQARLAQAEANLAGSQETLAAYRQLYADRLEARQQMENAKNSYETAAAQVQAAKAELDLLVAGATEDTIEAARGQVEQAKGALAAAKEQFANASIVAPSDGTIITKFRELGELVSPGTPIVRIVDLENAWVRVYAPLPTLGAIKVGQPVDVTTDTYGSKVYRGRVASISDEPEFTPKNVQTEKERVKLVYAIRVDVDNRSRELKPGMPADAVIKLDRVTEREGHYGRLQRH